MLLFSSNLKRILWPLKEKVFISGRKLKINIIDDVEELWKRKKIKG
jgi:hypothetical protein